MAKFHLTPAPPGLSADRKLRRAISALQAALFGLALVPLYAWLLRLGDDLMWDEAYNLRTYARHPVIALALYWEPNNHVLETFIKSIFFGLLRWPSPAFDRFGAFLIFIFYLAVVSGWFMEFRRRGAWAAATLVLILSLYGAAPFDQALRMRGYFLSMGLAFLFLGLAAHRGRWVENADTDPPASLPPGSARRDMLYFALLSTALLWTVPSNALMLPALWAALLLGSPLRERLSRAAALSAQTALFTALAYSPVALGFAIRVNRFENLPAGEPLSLARALATEPVHLARLAAPPYGDAAGEWVGLGALGFLGILALAAPILARQRRVLIPATALVFLTLALGTLSSLISVYPERAKTPMAVPLAVGAVLLVDAITRHRGPTAKLGLAFLFAGFAAASIPSVLHATALDRTASRTIGFLETYTRPGTNHVLVCNKSQPLQMGLERSLAGGFLAMGELDLDLIFKGEDHGTPLMKREGLRRVRDLLLPPVQRNHAAPGDIDLLVYVVDEKIGRDPTQWKHEALRSIHARLTHREEFRQAHYRLVIYR